MAIARRWGRIPLPVLALLLALLLSCGPWAAPAPPTPGYCPAQAGFVWIPPGPFQGGSDRLQRDYGYRISAAVLATDPAARAAAEDRLRQRRWFEAEADATTVDLPGFCLAAQLVTNADYQAFVRATGHAPPGITAAEYQAQGFLVHPYPEVEPYLWREDQYPPGRADHPVVLVSYEDGLAYARWRGQQDGVAYRLPTALEWEKAARSDDGRYFPWGDDWRDDATNWGQSGRNGTSPVGAYPLSRSPYGVEDMAGNVFEFTSSLQTRENRLWGVMKGCSWDDLPGFCRAAYRHTRPAVSRHILFGFRLVRQPAGASARGDS